MVLEGDRNVAEQSQTSQPGLLKKVIIYGTELMGLIHSGYLTFDLAWIYCLRAGRNLIS